MHILVAGGAGYVGAKLVPELLRRNHHVNVLDLYIYGEDVLSSVKNHPRLREYKGDVRNLDDVKRALQDCDAVIHLACISNDPSFELNPELGKSINLDSFEPFVKLCKASGVKRFIYASSSSVYGIKEEKDVTEEMSLEPLTDYSKFKAECERILLRYIDDDFIGTILRPATVCGYSPRQRLDVVVNILTNLAYHTGKIKILGGPQLRPNIHIDDMVRAYCHVLEQPKEKIQGEIFNVGYENHPISSLGEMVKRKVEGKRSVELVREETNDNRSYHVSSRKIDEKLGFRADFTVEKAVEDLVEAFEKGRLPGALTDSRYSNIKTMKEIRLT